LGNRIEKANLVGAAFQISRIKVAGSEKPSGNTAYLFEGILVSLVVQIWLLPFTVIYFHRVSPISIFLNLWSDFSSRLKVLRRFAQFFSLKSAAF
jgi:hypothetical protein